MTYLDNAANATLGAVPIPTPSDAQIEEMRKSERRHNETMNRMRALELASALLQSKGDPQEVIRAARDFLTFLMEPYDG